MTTNVNLGFVAAAGGTVDVITATYAPAPTALVDKMLVWFRATGANTSTTPTFNPNSLGAKTIVKNGGQPLVAGDIPAAGAIVGVVYNSISQKWEIIGYLEQSGWIDTGVDVVLKTITDKVGIGTATPSVKLHVVGASGQIVLFQSGSDTMSFQTNGLELDFANGGIKLGDNPNISGTPICITARDNNSLILVAGANDGDVIVYSNPSAGGAPLEALRVRSIDKTLVLTVDGLEINGQTGFTGTFLAQGGDTVTVEKGIIVSVAP